MAIDLPRLAFHQPRYLSDNGRLFFDSPADLVTQATNGKEDVYEYEPDAEGSCASSEGCVSLISTGNSGHESAFLDASASGNDAFFVTAQPLVASDHDTNFDVYDARVCGGAGCFTPPAPPPPPCSTSEGCRPSGSTSPGVEAPASATYSGPGNGVGRTERGSITTHNGSGTTKQSPRAQQLADALRACKKRYPHSTPRRNACEREAKKKYAPKKTKKTTKKTTKGGR